MEESWKLTKEFFSRRPQRLGGLLLAASALVVSPACRDAAEPGTVREEYELAVLTQRFQAALDHAWQEAQSGDEVFPGATAAFILDGGPVVGVATGFSDVEAEVPMSPDMQMPSGSIGKTYVAAVALSLAKEGKLGLDEPISRWLGDEDWFGRLPNGDEITVRMLLNHSSGLVDHAFEVEAYLEACREAAAAGDPEWFLGPRELVEFVLDREPLFPAGRGFHYTDTGYILAGLILEEASGSTYYEELQRRFLGPLGLRFTLPQDRRSVPGLAQGYAVASSELFGLPPKVVEDGELVFTPRMEWTGGGLFSNPQDLVLWAKILYEGRAMEGPYLDELLGSVAELEGAPPESAYGLGVFIIETDLGTTWGHGGFFPGYNSRVAYFPQHGVAVAMQINTDESRVETHLLTLARVLLEGLRGTGA